jgi:hypothetical protein
MIRGIAAAGARREGEHDDQRYRAMGADGLAPVELNDCR